MKPFLAIMSLIAMVVLFSMPPASLAETKEEENLSGTPGPAESPEEGRFMRRPRRGRPGPPGMRGRRGGRGLLAGARKDFKRLQERVRAKKAKIALLREKLEAESDVGERESIKAELKEAIDDLLLIRTTIAERKSRIARKLMERALNRYVEAEKELARLRAEKGGRAIMKGRRRGGPATGPPGDDEFPPAAGVRDFAPPLLFEGEKK